MQIKKDPQSWGRKLIFSAFKMSFFAIEKDPQSWGRKFFNTNNFIGTFFTLLKKDPHSGDEVRDHDKKPSPMRNLWQGRRSPFSVSESREPLSGAFGHG